MIDLLPIMMLQGDIKVELIRSKMEEKLADRLAGEIIELIMKSKLPKDELKQCFIDFTKQAEGE